MAGACPAPWPPSRLSPKNQTTIFDRRVKNSRDESGGRVDSLLTLNSTRGTPITGREKDLTKPPVRAPPLEFPMQPHAVVVERQQKPAPANSVRHFAPNLATQALNPTTDGISTNQSLLLADTGSNFA